MTHDAIPPADEALAAAHPGLEGEPEAWARVEAAWGDEAVHRAYLARFADLEGLAVAGGRYRAALDARPGDPLAARFREEVVKRATVQGLASLPRAAPRAPDPLRRRLALSYGRAVLGGLGALWPR
ncbi:MAG TPA: hypothetical protein VFM45_08795 [Anaeromyxobacteraceae bacterium]|nr:hypothetical protein [Anaeromyxobacteraceae bacterium]